jgi:hypothetical protein
LTRLTNAPGGILLVATIDDRIVGSVIGVWDGWRVTSTVSRSHARMPTISRKETAAPWPPFLFFG